MPGLVFGRLFDMGYLRLPVAAASGLLILCTFLTAQCTEFMILASFRHGFVSPGVFLVRRGISRGPGRHIGVRGSL